MWGISSVPEDLLTPHEGLCSMELVYGFIVIPYHPGDGYVDIDYTCYNSMKTASEA
jgi:hypothetical protein